MNLFKKTQQIISIEGMMCEHCSKHVKEALLSISGVKKVTISLEDKNAVITSKEIIDEKILKEKIEEAGYKFINVKQI